MLLGGLYIGDSWQTRQLGRPPREGLLVSTPSELCRLPNFVLPSPPPRPKSQKVHLVQMTQYPTSRSQHKPDFRTAGSLPTLHIFLDLYQLNPPVVLQGLAGPNLRFSLSPYFPAPLHPRPPCHFCTAIVSTATELSRETLLASNSNSRHSLHRSRWKTSIPTTARLLPTDPALKARAVPRAVVPAYLLLASPSAPLTVNLAVMVLLASPRLMLLAKPYGKFLFLFLFSFFLCGGAFCLSYWVLALCGHSSFQPHYFVFLFPACYAVVVTTLPDQDPPFLPNVTMKLTDVCTPQDGRASRLDGREFHPLDLLLCHERECPGEDNSRPPFRVS